MPGASNNKDVASNYGLTPREVELTIKAMITLVENNVKDQHVDVYQPDFEKLAKMANYKDAAAAQKNWFFTNRKLKAVGSNIDGEASSDNNANNAGGKKRGKRQADDVPEGPPAKRGRGRPRKTAPPPADEDEAKEQEAIVVKGEEDEV